MVNNYSTCILSQISPWEGCRGSWCGCRREESERERKHIERDGGDMRGMERGFVEDWWGKEEKIMEEKLAVGGNRLEDK